MMLLSHNIDAGNPGDSSFVCGVSENVIPRGSDKEEEDNWR